MSKPPSRLRYEQSHPTVSCRVSPKIYDLLSKARQVEGWSFASTLEAGLGILRAETQTHKQIRDQAYQRGFREAETEFKVLYGCSICGKPIPIQEQNAKQAAAQYMQEHKWAHNECHKRSASH